MSELTGWIALYGAILSTIALFWNIYNEFKLRPRLEFYADIGQLVDAPDSRKRLILQFINRGQRPAVVFHIGYEQKEGSLIKKYYLHL